MANGNANDGTNGNAKQQVPANRIVGLLVLGALALLFAIRSGLKVPTP